MVIAIDVACNIDYFFYSCYDFDVKKGCDKMINKLKKIINSSIVISCLFIVYYSIPEASSGIKKYRGPDCEASDRVLVFKKELVVIVDISSNSSLSKMEHQCSKMGRACAKLAH